MNARCMVLALALGEGCGASTVQGSVGEAGVNDRTAPVDAASRDVHTCDPSILADAGGDDVPNTTDGPYVVELAVDSQLHQCARMSDGTVRCRGFNDHGQLGLGSVDMLRHEAASVPGLTDVEQIVTSSPDYVTCTRHRDGTVRCWGSNEYDALGTGHADDEVCHAWSTDAPCRTSPVAVPGLTDVVSLAMGPFTVCAVRRDGSVWCWGHSNVLLPPGTHPTPMRTEMLSDVAALWYGRFAWIARLRSGRYTMTVSLNPVAIPPEAEIGEGNFDSHLCYWLPDTSVRCVGSNADGKIGNGTSSYPEGVANPWDPGLCGVRSIVSGDYHTCAVLADRTVSCWGSDEYDSLGLSAHETCEGILHETVCATRPGPVTGIDHVDRLFAGVWGTCALRVDHSVWCWGTLSPGRDGTPTPVSW